MNRKLYFATPDQLNDPLDSSISIAKEYERAREIVRARDKHPDARELFLISILDAFHKFKVKSSGKETGLNEALQQFIGGLGIAAFSKTETDALLWAHYASGHRGICLGFDSSLLASSDVFISGDVKYTSKPTYVELFLELTEELGKFVRPWDGHTYPKEQGEQFYSSQVSKLMRANLLVKSEKWRYEQEHRLISTKVGTHEFPPTALQEVICGTKMSATDRETVKNLLSHPDYVHVEMAEVKNVEGSFEFQKIDVQK